MIANSFAKVAECESGLEIAFPSVRKEGGDVVLIGNAPDGHVTHYLAGPWGKINCSKLKMQCGLAPNVNRLIIYSEYPDLTIYGYFANPENVLVLSKWDDVLNELARSRDGTIKVAVYPNADIQYYSANKGSKVLSFQTQ